MIVNSKLQEIMMRRSDASGDVETESCWDAGFVCENLYVGSLRAALDLGNLRGHNIGAILTVAGRLKTNVPSDIDHLVIDIPDHPSADIIGILQTAFQFLDGQLLASDSARKNVLVHCASGISRSVSVCCAWLMTRKAMNFESACKLIRINRPRAAPNVGFYAQLSVLSSFLKPDDATNEDIDLDQVREAYNAMLGGDGITNILFIQRSRANELHAVVDTVEEAMKHCVRMTDYNKATVDQWRNDLQSVIHEVTLLEPPNTGDSLLLSRTSGTAAIQTNEDEGNSDRTTHQQKHAQTLNIQDNPSRMIRDDALRKSMRLLEELDILSSQLVV